MREKITLRGALIGLICLGISAAVSPCTAPSYAEGGTNYETLEKEIVREVNLARKNPGFYAAWLRGTRQYYRGTQLRRPGEVPIRTQEGLQAVDEAIRFLDRQKPVGFLDLSRGLSFAARDLVAPQGASGGLGHEGPDGSMPSDRIERYGRWESAIGENVAYGQQTARDVVSAFIIDDGVPGRGHRKNLYSSDYRVMGVDCGPHSTYGTTCAITFAASYHEHPGR